MNSPSPDWLAWHQAYDDPNSALSRRLRRVRARLDQALTDQPPGPIRVLSMCAGQGRDLIGSVQGHPRRGDVTALLVEADPRNTAVAERAASQAGLEAVTVLTADASVSTAYAGTVPVDIALVCGVFGNIAEQDVRRTVERLPELLRAGGTVLWTRAREPADLTPMIRKWFADSGFAEIGFDTEDGFSYGVGTHLLTGPARPYEPGVRLFSFEGDQAGTSR
jgi:hypothetical protein